MTATRVLIACGSQRDLAAFEGVALAWAAAGADVTLAGVDVATTGSRVDEAGPVRRLAVGLPASPLIDGLGRALQTSALRASYALAGAVDLDVYDLIVAPLLDGLPHGLLMRRATSPARRTARIALWAETTSRHLALAEDAGPDGLACLTSDALERGALRLADALIVPGPLAIERLRGLGEPLPPVVLAPLPVPILDLPAAAVGTIGEIVVVGALSRRSGALLALDAIEDLATSGSLGTRTVTFLGPVPMNAHGLGAELLGIRALRWDFRFRVVEPSGLEEAAAYLASAGRLPLFVAEEADDDRLLRLVLATGRIVVATRGYETTAAGRAGQAVVAEPDAAAVADAVAGLLRTAVTPGPAAPRSPDCRWRDGPWRDGPWNGVLDRLLASEFRQPPRAGKAVGAITVCILHRFRPRLLADALASVSPHPGKRVEALVVDNAGVPSLNRETLQAADGVSLKVLRLDRACPPGAAYNRAAEEAAGDAIVLLDDDNALAHGGLGRFLDALETGWFDVVVTTLDLVDGEAARDPSVGRFMFLGDPGMAGLFFNGFGDTAMAIRRDAFRRVGGFPEPGHLAPVWDWILLARARALGLRIGVLMEPAVRYARAQEGSGNWLKGDRQGGRRSVRAAYGEALDAPLLARYAQNLQLAEP